MALCLTPLERAVLARISSEHPDAREALEAQLATATVVRRENSGAGFFTYLTVDRSTRPLIASETVFGNVAALIKGFKQPMLFLLFTKDGYVVMLEGATIDDSTVGVDLASLPFTMQPDDRASTRKHMGINQS
jgi:hypothetical protein